MTRLPALSSFFAIFFAWFLGACFQWTHAATDSSSRPPEPASDWLMLVAALSDSPDLEDVRAELAEQQAALKVAQSAWWPQLSVSGQWGASLLPLSYGESIKTNMTVYTGTASQTLFDPGKWHAVHLKQAAITRSNEHVRQVKIGLHLELVKRYLTLLKRHQDVAFAQFERQALQEQYNLVKESTHAGLSSPLDTLEAEARLDIAEAGWVKAKSTLTDARTAIHALTQRRVKVLFDLPEVMKTPRLRPALSWSKLLEQLKSHNAEIRAAHQELRIKEWQEKAYRSALWPTVGLNASWSRFKGSLASTFSNDPTLWAQATSIGVSFNWPLDLGGGVRAQAAAAHGQVLSQEEAIEGLIRVRQKELYLAYLGFKNSPAELKALKQALISAQTQLKSIQTAFQAGLRTNVDVLTHISQLVDAKRKYMNKRYDRIVSWAQIQALTGDLDEHHLEQIGRLLKQPLFDVFE